MRPTQMKALLRECQCPSFLFTNRADIQYLTGVELDDAVILIRSSGSILFADALERESAKAALPRGWKMQPMEKLELQMKEIRLCGFDPDAVSVARLKRWKKHFPKTKFQPVSGILFEYRRSKAPDELRAFRKAQRITRQIVAELPQRLKPGVTERQIAWWIVQRAVALGAQEMAFPSIVGFGSHTSRPHHKPTLRRLRRRDIVQIDMGARVDGYCADQSAVYFIGEPTREQRRVYDAVAQAKRAAIDAVRVGVSTRELDRIARRVLRRYKLERFFCHSLGHGVGVEIHEGVRLSQRAEEKKLLRNEIITIEPGVYLPRKFGIRLEEEIVVR